MTKTSQRRKGTVELGRYIVVDPAICHGKPTFKGTRVFVADVLADVERGLSWDFIVRRWGGGKITKAGATAADDFLSKATERCNADDDMHADEFSAQGLALASQ